MSAREVRDRIQRRARRAGLDLDPTVVERFERYYSLLAKWNEKINLTAFRLDEDGDHAVDRLLIEPAAAARHVAGTARLAMDVGSGGGSPAIPLAIAAPALRMRLVEIKTRKAVFLREALRALELDAAVVETARFEELLARPDLHEGLDLVTIRAVRVEQRTLLALQAFLKPGGELFLFRGPGNSDLEASPPPPLAWQASYPLVESLRSKLVVLRKIAVGRK